MKRRMLVTLILVGVALSGLTLIQVRGMNLIRPAGRATPGPHAPGRDARALNAQDLLPRSPGPAGGPAATPPDSTRWVVAEGRVVTCPGGDVSVSSERGGRLVRLLVEENQKVAQGALLAELDAAELRAALDEARARVAEAQANLALAVKTLERREEMVTRRVVAQQELDGARRDHDAAAARLGALRAEIARLQVQIGKCRITAPIAGTVTRRVADAGEVLEAGDAVLTLMDLDHLRVEGEADESDAGLVTLGARVRISADAYPGRTWRGTVEDVPGWVGPRSLKPVDPARPSDTRVLGIKIRFEEATPLKVGTTVELRVAAG